ncbi:hypothetical protein ACJJTC_018004 [Scirpophaga incertulas]
MGSNVVEHQGLRDMYISCSRQQPATWPKFVKDRLRYVKWHALRPTLLLLPPCRKQIEELTRTVAALSASDFRGRSRCSCDRDYGTSHHRSQSRRRSRSRPRNRELCWYHDRFGAKAKKCEPDCKWSVIEKDRLN